MARASYAPKHTYTGTGSLAAYAFSFKIEALAQLLVIEVNSGVETERELGTDTSSYISSVTFDAVAGGGTVNLLANLTSGREIIILLANDAPTQDYEFANKTSFTLKRFEAALDFIVGSVQRLTYRGKQAFRIHDIDDEDTFNAQFPPGVATSQSRVLQIDAAGTGVEYGPTATEVANAQTYANAASASADSAAADLVLTNADVVTTNADVVLTNADVVSTGDDVTATNADVVLTNADVVSTGDDVTATNADVVLTNADVVSTGDDVTATNADVVLTNADVVSTGNDVTSTNADVVSAAASAASAAAYATNVQTDTIDAGETIALAGNGKVISFIAGTGGADAMSVTPFGVTVGDFVDGQEIMLVGTDDTNYATLTDEDSQYGARLNGAISLTKGIVIKFVYSATLERFYESYRNN